MKKRMIKNLLFIVIMAVLCFSVGMTASAEIWGDYEYSVLEDGTIEITKYIGSETEVKIPAEIDGREVASIKNDAFNGCYYITGITVDENNEYFSNDERGVLFNKDKTTLVKYPCGNEGSTYKIPNSVTTIGANAFSLSIYLVDVILPESLLFVEETVFLGCFGITDIELPESVCLVDFFAFGGIFFLDEIIIKGYDTVLEEGQFCATDDFYFDGISYEDFLAEFRQGVKDSSFEETYLNMIRKYEVKTNEWPITFGTIYCHAGSTAESYAIENGVKYELTHFYEEDWTYDYENAIKYRKCIHCDEKETEALEIDTPDIPDLPVEEPELTLWEKLIDLIKSFFALVKSWFNR